MQSKKEKILNGEKVNDDLENINKKIKHLKIQKILLHAKKAQDEEKSNDNENDKNLDLEENDKNESETNIIRKF